MIRSKRSLYLVAGAGIALLLAYLFPLWVIYLSAPQYPETLRMYIWVDGLTGGTPHDLKNINILNHYVGMRPIHEEEFPEFRIMPYVLGGFVLLTLLTLLLKRVWLLYFNASLLFIAGVIGLYIFWRWEYEYGHNLDPNAPLKIPGMSYQPPLLFCKTLLNITACSFPYIGGLLVFLALGIFIYVIYREKKLA